MVTSAGHLLVDLGSDSAVLSPCSLPAPWHRRKAVSVPWNHCWLILPFLLCCRQEPSGYVPVAQSVNSSGWESPRSHLSAAMAAVVVVDPATPKSVVEASFAVGLLMPSPQSCWIAVLQSIVGWQDYFGWRLLGGPPHHHKTRTADLLTLPHCGVVVHRNL